jgi:predicted site-specific integrase-resolvase
MNVEVQTPHRWEKSSELIPDRRGAGSVRYCDLGKIMGLGDEDMPTIGYARVSSHDQHSAPPKAGGTRSPISAPV